MKKLLGSGVFMVMTLMALAAVSFGGGFQVPEQGAGAVGMGMAFTGKADDLSAIYYNPAGLTQLHGTHVSLGIHGISVKATYTRTGFAGVDTKDDVIPVPLLAVSTDFGGKLKNIVAAFGVSVPFGLRNDYGTDGAQRYITTNISLQDIYIGPAVAWQISPMISVGGGVQYVYSAAKIATHVNYGGAIYRLLLQTNPALNENPAYDGVMEITDATASNIAGNLGILVKPNDQWRIGLSWRSGTKVDLEGDVTLTIPATVTQLTGFQSLKTTGKTSVSLAQIVGLGVAYQPIPKLTVTSDLNWINWGIFKDYDFDFKDNTVYFPDKPQPREWDDTFSFRLGGEYWVAEQIAVRAGYSFDKNPIPDKSLGPEIPTGDTHYVTLGFGYKWKKLNVDVSYAHLFIKSRTVTESIRDPKPLGDYESSANVFGVSLAYAF